MHRNGPVPSTGTTAMSPRKTEHGPRPYQTQRHAPHQFDHFDYFPEHHYRTAMNGYERLLDGPDFEEWISELFF